MSKLHNVTDREKNGHSSLQRLRFVEIELLLLGVMNFCFSLSATQRASHLPIFPTMLKSSTYNELSLNNPCRCPCRVSQHMFVSVVVDGLLAPLCSARNSKKRDGPNGSRRSDNGEKRCAKSAATKKTLLNSDVSPTLWGKWWCLSSKPWWLRNGAHLEPLPKQTFVAGVGLGHQTEMCAAVMWRMSLGICADKATPARTAWIKWIARDLTQTLANADIDILRSDVNAALCTLV